LSIKRNPVSAKQTNLFSGGDFEYVLNVHPENMGLNDPILTVACFSFMGGSTHQQETNSQTTNLKG